MSEKKVLNEEELEQVTGGNYKLYDYEFDDSTKISDLLLQFPWLVNLNSDLQTAANFGLTVGTVKSLKGWTDEDINKLIADGEAMYNADGTLKVNDTGAIYGLRA